MSSYLIAMFITAVVETIVLWCCKYRYWKELGYFFLLNLISNFLVNFTYQHIWNMMPKGVLIFLLELGVYVFEVTLFGLITGYRKKMFFCVLLTNLISYSLGVLIYGI